MTLMRSTGLLRALMGVGEEPYDGIVLNSGIRLCAASTTGTRIYRLISKSDSFVTNGFNSGKLIAIRGPSAAGTNMYITSGVLPNSILIAGSAVSSAFCRGAVGCFYAVIQFKSGRIKDIFRGGVIRIYSGSQPASADNAEAGTLLVELSQSSNTFYPYKDHYGLHYGSASAYSECIKKRSTEVWSGVIQSPGGVAGWFRHYDNKRITGASSTAIRFDGAVALSGGQINLSSLTLTTGATLTLDSFQIDVVH